MDRSLSCRLHAGGIPLLALAALLLAPQVRAQASLDFLPNLVGLGVGVTPRYAGASETEVGAVPGIRYQFAGTNRFFEMYGPIADMNLLDSPNWQFGPALGIRLGRQDVQDAVVSRMAEIDTTMEAGLTGSWFHVNTEGVPWTARVGVIAVTDLGDQYHGLNATLFGNFWFPLSPRLFAGVGGGVSWASESYNRRYFGVSSADAQASGLPLYQPDAGLRQWYAWPALVYQLTPSWYLGAAVFYQRMAGKAGDSPIVTERGDANQWTWGLGAGYAWR